MQQQEYVGFGSVNNLSDILSKYNPRNIFLITGKNSYEKSGAKKIIGSILSGYRIIHFYDFEVNPKLHDIEKGISIFNKNDCNFVIAVGGGSVIDVAKSINVLASNEGKPLDYIKTRRTIENKGMTLVSIPTTSGSGSEATRFAVVYIDKTKYSLEHDFLLPDYAIVDSQFTMNLPKSITASTGMDALCQAIESYWCINSIDKSKNYARQAIGLVIDHLANAVNKPSEVSREAMSKAAHLAGKAINISKTTAPHSVSYPITSYFNVPHGHAVALTLVQMLVYNSQVTNEDILDGRGVDYVKKIIMEIIDFIGAQNIKGASEKITVMMKEVGLSTRLSELGIKKDEDIAVIVKNGFNPDRVKNNPRRLTEEALRGILDNIR